MMAEETQSRSSSGSLLLILLVVVLFFSSIWMMKSKMNSWKDARNSSNVITLASQNNLSIRNCNGDHFVITDPNTGQSVVGCHKKEMSTGVAMQIYKFFVRLGIAK